VLVHLLFLIETTESGVTKNFITQTNNTSENIS